MKHKKLFFFLTVPLTIIVCFFVWIFFFSNLASKNNNTSKQEDVKPEFSVYVIGDKAFPSSKKVKVIHSDFSDDFSAKENRFILVSIDTKMTLDKQKILYDWINKGKIVGFFGEDIDSTVIPDKFNMPIPITQKPVGTTIDFNFIFYGYGYSNTSKTYAPLFHLLDSNYKKQYANYYEVLLEFLIQKNEF